MLTKFLGSPRKNTGAAMAATALMLGLGFASNSSAAVIQVTVENLSSTNGLYFTPAWVGFHNGSFDLFNTGSTASTALERAAEDGDYGQLRASFASTDPSGVDGVVLAPAGFGGAPVFDPGETATMVFSIDPSQNRYLSYFAMVLPSNDAFIANDGAQAYEIFDAAGNFNGPTTILIGGTDVLDALTEANTEMNAAFFDQTAANTGTPESGNIAPHAGFIGSAGNPGGTPIFLGGTSTAPPGIFFDATAADFTQTGYQLARITVTRVPEPATIVLFGLGLAGLAFARKRSGISLPAMGR